MRKYLLILLALTLMASFAGCTTNTVVLAEAPSSTIAPTPEPTDEPTPEPTPTPAPIQTTTPEPTEPPIPEPTQASVIVSGDLMCLSAQLSAARKNGEYHFDYCFAEIAPTIRSYDLAIGNLETLIADGFAYTGPIPTAEVIVTPEDGSEPYPTTTRTGSSKINAPESYLTAVLDAGFDVLTQANNHINDRKTDGIIRTIEKLDEHGVLHTGAYIHEEDKAPLIVDVNDIRVGILGYTKHINGGISKASAYMADLYNEDIVAADIAAAKQAGAEFVVVCMHWGVENTHRVSGAQRKKAQFVADAGADLIFGAHPHAVQPFETIETERGSVPVIYSMGNLVSSMSRTMNKDGVLVEFVLEKNYEEETVSLQSLSYIPTLCAYTNEGGYVILPADSASIETSDYATQLEKSRARTIKVLGEEIAAPK